MKNCRGFWVLIAALVWAFPARADYFAGGYYRPAMGQVGKEMVSDLYFNVEDVPDQCLVVWKAISVAGELPPGLIAPGKVLSLGDGGAPLSAFFGMPLQAGEYPVTVKMHGLGCENGGNYGDREIRVNFRIVP